MHLRCRLKHPQLQTELAEWMKECDLGSLFRTNPACEPERLARLLDEHFDGQAGLLAEFPLLVEASLAGRGWVFQDSHGEYVAHAAWRPLELCMRARRLGVAGVGLVTTHARFRGRGLASELVRACLDQARSEGLGHALLFSPPRELYSRLGFEPAGSERIVRYAPRALAASGGASSQATPGGRAGEGIRAGCAGDAPQLVELLEQHPLRVSRSAKEFERLLAIPDTHLFVLEAAGRIEAYCVEGKGRDLRGVVHEWAGDPSGVARIIEHVAASYGVPLSVLSPASEPAPVPGPGRVGAFALVCSLAPKPQPERVNRVGGELPEPLELDDFYVWGLDSF